MMQCTTPFFYVYTVNITMITTLYVTKTKDVKLTYLSIANIKINLNTGMYNVKAPACIGMELRISYFNSELLGMPLLRGPSYLLES